MKLPLIMNPEIAEICGIHAGDGYLRSKKSRNEWDVSGSFEEREYYDTHVLPLVNTIFNLDLKGKYFPSRGTYGFVIRNKELVSYIHGVLGFPYGNKSTIVETPSFVFGDNQLMIGFLRGIFDTDGHFSCMKRKSGKYIEFKKKFHYYPRISLSTVSYDLSLGLSKILKILNIKTCESQYRPKKSTENLKYRLDINGSEEVINFFELIKPKNTVKASRYNLWRKLGICPTNITFKERKDILNGDLDVKSFYSGS
jgi:hypothetical protein